MNDDFSLAHVLHLGEDEVRDLFQRIRWEETDGAPVCPKCDSESIYILGVRNTFKCKDCGSHFSLTSGTTLASRKMPHRTILLGVVLFLSGAKGVSSIQLGRMLDCQQCTAFDFGHKLREIILQEQSELPPLSGEIEIDGAFFGGHLERFPYRNKGSGIWYHRRRFGDRRVVVIARQRGGRTITCVVPKESAALPFLKERIEPGSIIHADDARGWDSLKELFHLMRGQHKVCFVMNGACTNRAESFFAMLRRKQLGVHHRMSGDYLNAYAAELAWRQDHRHLTEEALIRQLIKGLLRTKTSWLDSQPIVSVA
jgi:transposase-like protein